jgi:DNA-binding response OmpR family regulator
VRVLVAEDDESLSGVLDLTLRQLRALPRRPAVALPPALTVGDLKFDQAGHEVRSGDRRLALTMIELGTLETLMRLSPAVANRRQQAHRHGSRPRLDLLTGT